ncbi:MAG TPA: TfuA-like protein [Gemmatimonadaceae bacterium]|nr:TfuA-like protein [Gemmatimonadaceae bacterium]
MPASRNVAFVGPTYAPIADTSLIERAGFEPCAPARRGDMDALDGEPGVAVLVDGRFNHALAVGHAELRRAVERGWSVWGLSSMGAIRAYELRNLGVRGFGNVYAHFLAADDFQDDEVALMHAPTAPYETFSEPLIHIRYCLAEMVRLGEIDSGVARRTAGYLKSQWFAARTLDGFVAALTTFGGDVAANSARAHVARFDQFRVKTKDLIAFFAEQPWRSTSYIATPAPAPFLDSLTEDAA